MSEENAVDAVVQQVKSHCCEKIQNLYSKIQLLNRQQIDVDLIYVDVYVLQNSTSDSNATIPGLLKNSNLRNDFDRLGLNKRDKRSPGFDAAMQYSRLMVLGKPGSGKTTFLRHLAVANCKREFLGDCIPVLIEFRFISNISELNLLNYIHEEFGLTDINQTKEILQRGKVVIFLDGLDEISSQFRRNIQNHIIEFSRNYYKNHLIVTCRTQTSEYILPEFNYVEVADFNPQQVKQFAKNWFAALADTQQQAMELAQKFITKLELPENKQTAELAVTPILLSLVCWIFNDVLDLPAKRSDLYERGMDLLLSKWDKRRGIKRDSGSEIYRQLTLLEKKQLLSYIAKIKFEQEQYILFEQSEIQRYIAEYLNISNEDAEVVLREIEAQHGLLIERAQGIWSFSHLTFQEYLVAKWFCNNQDWEELVIRCTDKSWREIFILIFSFLQNIDSLSIAMKLWIDKLIDRDKEINIFLIWLEEKSELVSNNKYKLVAIKALFLAFIHNLESNVDDNLFLKIDFNLKHEYDLLYELVYGFFSRPQISANEFTVFLMINNFTDGYFNYHLSKVILTNKDWQPEDELEFEMYGFSCISSAYWTIIGSNPYFNKNIFNVLPPFEYYVAKDDPGVQFRWDFLDDWWSANDDDWKQNLSQILAESRHLGNMWQPSKMQKETLHKYYDANKLLIDCLNSTCKFSDTVRQEIESTLLLPISEIEKRKREQKIE